MSLLSKNAMSAERHAAQYPVKVKEWFEQDRLHRFNYAALAKIVSKNSSDNKVLDWGCGNLLWSLALFPGSEITGVETNEEALEYARVNAAGNGAKFKGLLLNEAVNLPSDYYDVALSMGLIELIKPEDFTNVFSAVLRTLKPGGRLICTMHNWRLFSALYLPWVMRGGYEGYCQLLGTKISKKSLKQVENDFQELGFQVVKRGGYNPYLRFMWPWMLNIIYLVHNRIMAHWYYSQYITLVKPINTIS